MEAIFGFTPKNGKMVFDNEEDVYKYCCERNGIHQTMTLKDTSKLSEKQKMYDYLFGPVMDCAVRGFTAAGYNGIDKVKARYILEAEFCKEEIYNPISNKTKIRTEHVSSMGKARLLKFIVDVLLFLELELSQRVPDSEEYKMKLKYGKDIRRIK